MPRTKVQTTRSELSDGEGGIRETTQYRATIPKELAEALDAEGKAIEWSVASGSALRAEIVEREESE